MGRPSIPLLDRDKITDAALRQVDRRGDFTMPDLARDLHVSPGALYHHVTGRAEIVALMRERLARTVDASAFDQLPWDEAVRAWAYSYRDTFARHASAVRLLTAEPITDPILHAMYEHAAASLIEVGFETERVLAIVTAFESFILGSALDLVAPPVMVEDIVVESTPSLAAVVSAAPAGRERAEQAFRTGLDAMLEGLRTTIPSGTGERAGSTAN